MVYIPYYDNVCVICRKEKRNLANHMRVAHGPKKSPCPYCGAMKVGLDAHIRDKHTNLLVRPVAASRPPATPLCPECSAPMKMRTGPFGLFLGCSNYPACRATHGVTKCGEPMGTPVDQDTRKLRIAAHNLLDECWRVGPSQVFRSRGEAYEWVQRAMGLAPEEAHIGLFDREQCKALIEALWIFDRAEVTQLTV